MLYVLVNGGLVPADEAPKSVEPSTDVLSDTIQKLAKEVPVQEAPVTLSVPVALPVVPEIK